MYALQSWNVRVKPIVPYPNLNIEDEWSLFLKSSDQILHSLISNPMI
jgi:hypothetical protein